MDEGEEENIGTMESEDEQMHDPGHKSPEPTGLERPEQVGIQSPISLVRSIISSPSSKTPPKSERRAKVPPSSASLNASGFGFDFLNWNSSDSPAKEMQSSSSSSSYSSGGLKVDESFNVEELLKQAEISSVVHKSSSEEQPNDFRVLVQLKKKENNTNVATPESAENNGSPIPSIVPSLPAKALAQAQCLSQPPPQPPPLMAVTITPPPLPPSLVPLSVINGTGGVHLRPPSMTPSRFVPPTTPPPLQRPSPVAFSRPTVAHSSVRLLHRLDVPPPVLHMPPPPLIRAAGPKNSKMMSTTCTSVVLLDPEAIMCCRIQLNELRAVFAAATRNSVLVLWHQMITAKLMYAHGTLLKSCPVFSEVGVDAKPYLALADEFVAAGTLERMEAHLCDKNGLDLHKLMACTVGVAREQRSRKPEMRVLFLSAMIAPGSDEASNFVANQIEVVSAAQFVEQFK
uniref:FH2 domain-containing protein n=1 Tax=Globodera pallida TaxID=36090 RepID=A0A183C334_GLOPA